MQVFDTGPWTAVFKSDGSCRLKISRLHASQDVEVVPDLIKGTIVATDYDVGAVASFQCSMDRVESECFARRWVYPSCPEHLVDDLEI